MKWAFWRRRKPRATSQRPSEALNLEDAGEGDGGVARVRMRLRHRLIGAAALLLGTAVVVPMILDQAPRPLPDNIPIDIPSERTPFAPRLSLPADSSRPSTTDANAPAAATSTDAAPAKPAAAETAPAPPAPAPDTGSTTGSGRSSPQKASAPHAQEGHWFLQAAALSSEAAAQSFSERLSGAGMAPFVERAAAADGVLYRVRLGPFSSRDAAVRARRHLHSLGVGSNVIRIEQGER